ncbi:unnamed protein product [Lepeophtheirus salmonis]|uniref:(salmon louse) hypothetical protein n=1 Tax=Lepeophtheirus salmonis TaxID=72036 RepID=A0A7R8H8P8_LEPSM|nr:unnamed protein product [Lepeophtheirus salmonis]CAF2945814.1 unnamed protein product [Lepeophtheirus salmonis]
MMSSVHVPGLLSTEIPLVPVVQNSSLNIENHHYQRIHNATALYLAHLGNGPTSTAQAAVAAQAQLAQQLSQQYSLGLQTHQSVSLPAALNYNYLSSAGPYSIQAVSPPHHLTGGMSPPAPQAIPTGVGGPPPVTTTTTCVSVPHTALNSSYLGSHPVVSKVIIPSGPKVSSVNLLV